MKTISILSVFIFMFAVTVNSAVASTTPEHNRATIIRSSDVELPDRNSPTRDTSRRSVVLKESKGGDGTVINFELENANGDITLDVTTIDADTSGRGENVDIIVILNGKVVSGNDHQDGDGDGVDGTEGEDGRDGTSEEDTDVEGVKDEEKSENNDRYNNRPPRDIGDRTAGRQGR